jgi:aspartyl-tRNA(Asn)/glutamyl-tRNA(Gln) amidotransferase subunit C
MFSLGISRRDRGVPLGRSGGGVQGPATALGGLAIARPIGHNEAPKNQEVAMIQQDEVKHIAKLARLQLSEDELPRYTEQVGRILAFFDELKQLDTAGVPPTAHPIPVSNAFRADVLKPSLGADEALANAPQREGDYFRVPKILES